MTLQDRITELEAATVPSFVLDAKIQSVLMPGRDDMMPPPYSASVDNALRLCTNVLPGWQINLSVFSDAWSEASIGSRDVKQVLTFHRCKAIALVIAIAKAKLAQEVQP